MSVDRLEKGNAPGTYSVGISSETQPLISPARAKAYASLDIANWMYLSIGTVIFNKWIIDTAGFRFPIILTTWHLVFATVATQILAHTTSLLDSRVNVPLTYRVFFRTIIPSSFLFSGSLILSNIVYLYHSVAFIQMLDITVPITVLISWASAILKPDLTTFGNILVILSGAILVGLEELSYSWIGISVQFAGMVCEGARLVMVRVMVEGEGIRMDPLVGLYYFAPIGTIISLFFAIIYEGSIFQWTDVEKVGYGILLLNAFMMFLFSVAGSFMMTKASGSVSSLGGIAKSILLVLSSIFIWGTPITMLQGLGYIITLSGLIVHSIGHHQITGQWRILRDWFSDLWSEKSSNDVGSPFANDQNIVMGMFVIITALILVFVFYVSSPMQSVTAGKFDVSKMDIAGMLGL